MYNRAAAFAIATALSLGFASSSHASLIKLIWSGTTGTGTVGSSDIAAVTGDEVTLDVLFDPSSDFQGVAAVSLDFMDAPLSLLSVTQSALNDPGYASGNVEAQIGSAVGLGDGNADGIVGLSDLVGMREVFFSPDPAYDFNVDGVVNFIDLGLQRANYGTGSTGSTVLSTSTNVLHLGLVDFNGINFESSSDALLGSLTFEVTGVGPSNITPFFNDGMDGVFNMSGFSQVDVELAGATISNGTPPPSNGVPAPATLALLSLGLIGLRLRRRE